MRIVVVGASLAGCRASEALRKAGFEGELVLIGSEVHFPPFDRPPLSKQLLSGGWSEARARIRVAANLDPVLRLGRTAVSLDAVRREVTLDDGTDVAYDGLVVATGASPRRLDRFSGSPHPVVHVLRTYEDCLGLRSHLARASSMVVIGAGLIGMEVAATARSLGLEVTVIDVLPSPMCGAIGAHMGRAVARLHEAHGVQLLLGVGVREIHGGRFTEVLLDDGRSVAAEVAVVAIGAIPETAWLEGAGLELADGLLCDEFLRATGAERIVGAGDVVRWLHPMLGRTVRVEHWTNAATQGPVAAHNLVQILAGKEPNEVFAEIPYFWSDQYGWKLQLVGIAGDEVVVEEGTVDENSFVAVYRSGGAPIGALCVNRPGRLPTYRRRLLNRMEG